LKTVQRALEVAIQLEDAPMMARLLIEHAKRAQSEETPLQAWRKGHRERALELATDIVFKRDHKLGTLWSLLLAWVAESEGERDWSKRFLDEVRKRWEGGKLVELESWYWHWGIDWVSVQPDWRGDMAAFLLGELLRQVEGSVEVAGLVLDDEFKMELATSWASKGLFDQALKVTEGIKQVEERARSLAEIAGEMAKAGMFEQALKVAEGIEKADERAWALREIAREMARAGEVERAVGIVEREMAVRTEGLPSVLEMLAGQASEGDGRSKEGFLKLLPLCGWSLEFAYKACGLLAWLYPERGEEIAGVIAATGD
jgi:hypothetical protein